jgi:hypothetical protein
MKWRTPPRKGECLEDGFRDELAPAGITPPCTAIAVSQVQPNFQAGTNRVSSPSGPSRPATSRPAILRSGEKDRNEAILESFRTRQYSIMSR